MENNTSDFRQSVSDNYCFACGRDNPFGLHLKFEIEGDKFIARKTLTREFQSFTGVAHGGIVTTLLDEAMGGYLVALGKKGFTARIEVRYRHPTPIGEELTITGWQESTRGHFVNMKAAVALPDGTVTAEAKATMSIAAEQEN
ncbi:MAG: PaaI family thioesterase [Schwartzia sp.]|nr:PaaI family thioesterase [Schwartzia sp. (in: firmicutes)]